LRTFLKLEVKNVSVLIRKARWWVRKKRGEGQKRGRTQSYILGKRGRRDNDIVGNLASSLSTVVMDKEWYSSMKARLKGQAGISKNGIS
jgi:hypothetical protein